MRKEKNKFSLELFSLKDQPCRWEMLENNECEKIQVFVFALDCWLSTEEEWTFLTEDNRMLLKT